jgi:two-component system, NtrC family, response regulator HydG
MVCKQGFSNNVIAHSPRIRVLWSLFSFILSGGDLTRAESNTDVGDGVPEKLHSVLIIDDDGGCRTAIHLALIQRFRVQVEGVESGAAAIERVLRGKHYDLILLDLKMPGMNGVQTYRRLRDVSSGSQLVFMSAERDTELWKEAEGLSTVLYKPELAEELVRLLSVCRGNT